MRSEIYLIEGEEKNKETEGSLNCTLWCHFKVYFQAAGNF